MSSDYFSDRARGPVPRASEDISSPAWGGLVAIMQDRVADGSFGKAFPEPCQDPGEATVGTNEHNFSLRIRAEIPDLEWPIHHASIPPAMGVLDMLEFAFRNVAFPKQAYYHPFFRHHHLEFDVALGREKFRDEVNRILGRNGLVYQLEADGHIKRILPELLRTPLTTASFQTGDTELDSLLEVARAKFLDRDPAVRKDSLEKLWDGWERLKTIEPGANKRMSTKSLLDRTTSEPAFRAVLEHDADTLTKIGNEFRIRHSEIDKTPKGSSEQLDYFFQRLFTLIRLLLRSTRRGE